MKPLDYVIAFLAAAFLLWLFIPSAHAEDLCPVIPPVQQPSLLPDTGDDPATLSIA